MTKALSAEDMTATCKLTNFDKYSPHLSSSKAWVPENLIAYVDVVVAASVPAK
jgi:hypothetical protein